jgi:ATPase subunit of ABC transporter with duplicated ATPase domains
MAVALELNGIRKSFDDFVALDDARLGVEFGEVHALLGENGAGKSSLMNVAAGALLARRRHHPGRRPRVPLFRSARRHAARRRHDSPELQAGEAVHRPRKHPPG